MAKSKLMVSVSGSLTLFKACEKLYFIIRSGVRTYLHIFVRIIIHCKNSWLLTRSIPNAANTDSEVSQSTRRQNSNAFLTLTEVYCVFLTGYSSNNGGVLDYLNVTGLYWGSGTNQGALSEDNYGWCGDRTLFQKNESVWAENYGQPNDIWGERCAAYYLTPRYLENNGLHDYPCTPKFYAICEAT